MQALEITFLEDEAGLRLAGELDLHSAQQLKDAFAGIRSNGRQAKLDLSELTFIDSSGLHAIAEVAGAPNGTGPVILEGASETMLRMFEITNLTQHPGLEIR